MTTKVRLEPVATAEWAADQLKSAIDSALARAEDLLQQTRRWVQGPVKTTVIDANRTTMGEVASAPGQVVLRVDDKDVDCLLEADARAALR